jgi:regulator of sigma E protease
MTGALISMLSFLFAIALLVAVHEFGHFYAARRLGIQVLRFSVGFGRPLWSRRAADGVEYVVGAFPFGGYVKMLDERDADAPIPDPTRAFNRAAPWKRAIVLFAGPFANLAFAVAAYWVILMLGVPGLRPLIGVVPPDSPAAVAGLRNEDEFLRVDGRATPTWEAASLALLDAVLAGAPAVALEVRDAGGTDRRTTLMLTDHHGLTEPGVLLKRLGLAPWQPRLPPKLGEVVPEGPAGTAGLRSGDLIVALDGEAIDDWRLLVERIQARPGEVVTVSYERAGVRTDVPVPIAATEQGGRRIGRMEVRPFVPAGLFDRMLAEQRFGPVEALPEAVGRTRDLCVLTLKMMWRMLTGGASLANISGPINIAQYAGVTASISVVAFLGFLAVISVSLGVLNLLPVPILDGGQLAFLAVESATGRPVPATVELWGQQVGIVLLVGLMGLAFYNDIARLLG